MTIVFAALTSTTGDATGILPALTGRAYEVAPNGAAAGVLARLTGRAVADDIGYAAGALPAWRGVSLEASGDYALGALARIMGIASAGMAAPTVSTATGVLLPLVGSSTGFTTSFADAAGVLPRLRTLALELDGYSAGVLPTLRGSAWQVTPPSSYGVLLQSPGYLAVTGLSPVQRFADLADGMKISDVMDADFIHALADLISFSDTYSLLAQVTQALADGMTAADIARFIWEAGLIDTFIASAVPSGMAQITVLLADGFKLTDGASALSTVLAALADGFYATLTINSGNDIYTAWVMTPETKAMRSYSNWPFNSYATLGPHFLGAGDAGIYRIGGTTDDGAVIRSSIVTGLMNLGAGAMSGVNKAYIGTTTSGNLLMRVEATTFDGTRINQTYRMVPSVVNDARAMRIDVGRGFRSLYWKFELANDTDGASFEVHDWHVLPVTLTGKLI